MELKEFVSATLTAIVEGMVDAQERAKKFDAHVNPGGLMRNAATVSENSIWDNRTNNYARTVMFDVALTVEEGTKTNAKVGVAAGLLNLGAGGGSENKQLAVNRVQFSVPVLFPTSQVPAAAREPHR